MLTKKLAVIALACLFTSKDEINVQETRNSIVSHYYKYQAEQDFGIKKANFEISETGFIRYKKTDKSNRIEYYSVKLDKINSISYLGTEKTGWLLIKCMDESVIYQTYQDNNGNIDDMVSEIKIPIKNIELIELNKWTSDIFGLISKIK